MSEQEIFESLCLHIRVLDKANPMDCAFFERCYNICTKDKDEMTKGRIWKVVCEVAREFNIKKYKFIKMLRDWL